MAIVFSAVAIFIFFFFFFFFFLLRNTNVTEHMPRKKSQEFKDSQTIHSNYKSKKNEEKNKLNEN